LNRIATTFCRTLNLRSLKVKWISYKDLKKPHSRLYESSTDQGRAVLFVN